MRRILFGTLGIGLLGVALFALPMLLAQQSPFPPLPVLQAIDKNGDGEISSDELAAAPAALRSLDKNADGMLEGEEIIPDFGFGPPGFGGPGGGGGRGGFGGFPNEGGVDLDPLVGLDNARMPLRSKLLAVPSLKNKYLQRVRTIAEQSLTWAELEPVIASARKLLDSELAADTRKLTSHDGFLVATSPELPAEGAPRQGLRNFIDARSDSWAAREF